MSKISFLISLQSTLHLDFEIKFTVTVGNFDVRNKKVMGLFFKFTSDIK